MGKKDNWFFEARICLRCGRRAESFERRPAAGASRRLVATVLSANHPPAQPRAQTGPRIRRLKKKAINFPYGMMEFLEFKEFKTGWIRKYEDELESLSHSCLPPSCFSCSHVLRSGCVITVEWSFLRCQDCSLIHKTRDDWDPVLPSGDSREGGTLGTVLLGSYCCY